MIAKRTLWVGWFATVLLLGGLDWHPAGEPPDELVPQGAEVYFTGASHPGQPTHLFAVCSFWP